MAKTEKHQLSEDAKWSLSFSLWVQAMHPELVEEFDRTVWNVKN